MPECDPNPIDGMPVKRHYTVNEVIAPYAKLLYTTEIAARGRIYRAIETGELYARRYLGALRIPRHEVERMFAGEPASNPTEPPR